jgi:hypothetical protein
MDHRFGAKKLGKTHDWQDVAAIRAFYSSLTACRPYTLRAGHYRDDPGLERGLAYG